jgi:XTP/dITP diphosphohydrolase
MRVVVATGNPGKLAEIRAILADLDLELVPQDELGVPPAEETGATLAENALIKARHAAAATGLPAIADDSGLLVDALDGRPGVHSARYAGPAAHDRDNIEKLLAELEGVEAARRGASFRCVAAFVRDPADPAPVLAEGRWEGRIADAPRGSGGFGYDPVFFDPRRGRTVAEMTEAEKNASSHRGQAFRQLAALLRERRPPGETS